MTSQNLSFVVLLSDQHFLLSAITLFVATLCHIGLSFPHPRQDEWEQLSTKERGKEGRDTVKGYLSGRISLFFFKAIIWISVILSLASMNISHPVLLPYSKPFYTFLKASNLPRLVLIRPISWTYVLNPGVLLALLSTIIQLSSLSSLGQFAYFPVTTISNAPKLLYVPQDQIPRKKHYPGEPYVPENKNPLAWSLRPSHELVSSGLYDYIRHPMYLSTILSIIPTTLLYLLAPNSPIQIILHHFVRSLRVKVGIVDLRTSPVHIVSAFALLFAGLAVQGLLKRISSEEEALSKRFDKKWRFYEWSVQSKLIPGIY